MSLITLFVRREATTDDVAIKMGIKGKKDTVYYKDALCTEPVARRPWYFSGHPRRNSRRVMLNCFYWGLQWVH